MPRKSKIEQLGLGEYVLQLHVRGCSLHPGGCTYGQIQQHVNEAKGLSLTPDNVREYLRSPARQGQLAEVAAAPAAIKPALNREAEIRALNEMVDDLLKDYRVKALHEDNKVAEAALGRVHSAVGMKLRIIELDDRLARRASSPLPGDLPKARKKESPASIIGDLRKAEEAGEEEQDEEAGAGAEQGTTS